MVVILLWIKSHFKSTAEPVPKRRTMRTSAPFSRGHLRKPQVDKAFPKYWQCSASSGKVALARKGGETADPVTSTTCTFFRCISMQQQKQTRVRALHRTSPSPAWEFQGRAACTSDIGQCQLLQRRGTEKPHIRSHI